MCHKLFLIDFNPLFLKIPVNLVLLEDEDTTVEQAEITDGMEILIEGSLSWS